MPVVPPTPLTCTEYEPGCSVAITPASRDPGVRGNAPTDANAAASSAFQLSLLAATVVDEFGPKTVSVGSASAAGTLKGGAASRAPTARITTCFEVVPL